MQKITPCLWFNFQAEEAVAHYMRIFSDGKIIETVYYNDAVPQLKGKPVTILFELAGQQFSALNAGPQRPFTEAISLSVDCADQAEVDRLWNALVEDGTPGQCSWLKDKFGVSWQIVPRRMMEMLRSPDAAAAARAMAAMMTMSKLDIAALEAAFNSAAHVDKLS